MLQKRGLTIDNGGSEVRYLGIGGNTQSSIKKLENRFGVVVVDNFWAKDVEDKLGIAIVLESPNDEYKKTLVQGNTCAYYDHHLINMTAGRKKTHSEEYYLRFIYTVARDAMETVLEMRNANIDTSNGDEDNVQSVNDLSEISKLVKPEDVELDYILTTLIPIAEWSSVTNCANLLRHNLCGSTSDTFKEDMVGWYKVQFPLLEGSPVIRFRILPENIAVMPEDGVAVSACAKDLGEDDYTLMIGFGHVTFDLCIYKGTKVHSSVSSNSCAGNTLLALLDNALTNKDFHVGRFLLGNVIETGSMRKGHTIIDVADIVREQKEIYVKNFLADKVRDALAVSGVDDIQNIIPVGALANDSPTGDIVDMLIDACGFEGVKVRKVTDDLRYTNITVAHKVTTRLYKAATRV